MRSVDKVQHEINKSFFFKDDYPLALKIVRGAYLVEEKVIEKRDNLTLIWKSKNQTDSSYNFNIEKIIQYLNKDSIFILATHNNESNLFLMDLVNQSDKKEFLKERVYFATLLGLNDHFAFETLKQEFNTIKERNYYYILFIAIRVFF